MSFKSTFRKYLLPLAGIFCALFLTSCGKSYHIGDIVMKDGTVVPVRDYASYKGKSEPEAVIFSVHGGSSEESDRVLGVMLKDADTELQFSISDWLPEASEDSDYEKSSVLNQTFDSEDDIYVNQGFNGVCDGRYVAYNLSTKDIENYFELLQCLPALSSCFMQGAYLPSASELYAIFESEDILDASFAAVGGQNISEDIYWSSSADLAMDTCHLTVNLHNGLVAPEKRTELHKVRGIKCYSDERMPRHDKYHVGDIILDDGTVVPRHEFEDYKGNAKPMAVIFTIQGGHYENKYRVIGVGVNFGESREIAEEGTFGERTNFTLNQAIVCDQTYDLESGNYINTGFMGTVDGRNSWENICKMDAKKETASANYPVFDYAVNYAKNNNLSKFKKGWYIPSAAETYELFKSKNIVNSALNTCGKEDLPDLVWTSSQDYYDKSLGYIQDFNKGQLQTGYKYNSYPVICVYTFEDKQ